MQITQFIKDHGLAALTEQFGITIGEYPDYVVLNYSQIDSPKHNPMVDECRALILDRHTLQPLARGFDRFYNNSTGGTHPLVRWHTLRAQPHSATLTMTSLSRHWVAKA
jgi:hypothetical protein